MAGTGNGLSELVEIKPRRVDAVKSPANGFPVLVMKSVKKDVDRKGNVDETPDIDGAKNVICLLAKLIESEARELGAGDVDEICDIELLTNAAYMIKCFLNREMQGQLQAESISKALLGDDIEAAKRLINEAAKGLNDMTNTPESTPVTETPTTEPVNNDSAPVEKSADELVAEAVEKAVAPFLETIESLRTELTAIKAQPVPGGPAITSTAVTKSVPNTDELARYKRLAKSTEDRELARYYADRVAELESAK